MSGIKTFTYNADTRVSTFSSSATGILLLTLEDQDFDTALGISKAFKQAEEMASKAALAKAADNISALAQSIANTL